jgi:ectoine hydroxylase
MQRYDNVALSRSGASPMSAMQTAGVMFAHSIAPAAECYETTGYLLIEDLFSSSEIANIKTSIPDILRDPTERTVLEASQRTVRSVYGIHEHSPVFGHLARHPRLLERARQLLRGDVYVYQSKLNTKAAFDGDVWPWHQDYVYWQREDSMPAPRALTVAVFLDDVTEFNGPMMVVPGSHRRGVLPFVTNDGQPAGYDASAPWLPNVVASLKYTLEKHSFMRLARQQGLVAPKARAGAALFFDCNLAHASAPNLSPFDRTLAFLTYNRVDNAPPAAALHRPAFLVSRDTRATMPVNDQIFEAA